MSGRERNVVASNPAVLVADPLKVGPQVFARSQRHRFDVGAAVGGNATLAPVADHVLADAKGSGELAHSACAVDCSGKCVHEPIITHRDPVVNTHCVRRRSQPVKNGGMNFAARLKALRESKGMTQEALALACGWSGQSRIANYESTSPKARQPKPNEIPLIAKALGVPVAELFENEGGVKGQPSHLGRIDPTMLAESIAALRELAKRQGRVYDPEKQPELLVYAYQLREGLGTTPSTAEVIDMGAQLNERLQTAGGEDGPENGRHADSADRKRAKGRAQG